MVLARQHEGALPKESFELLTLTGVVLVAGIANGSIGG
jgi:hypothetical protein